MRVRLKKTSILYDDLPTRSFGGKIALIFLHDCNISCNIILRKKVALFYLYYYVATDVDQK